MNDVRVKEISRFVDSDVLKTRLVITQNGKDTEIIFTGDGKLKVATQV